MTDALWWPVLIAGAYLVGAIPFGYLVGRAKGIDIREHGSGNIGATNVRRVLGRGAGNVAFLLDVFKGAVPVLVAGGVMGTLGAHMMSTADAWGWLGVSVATVIGHVFPVYLNFKGGKGVATGLGSLAALWPAVTPAPLIALALWILTVKSTRYVSVASCVAAVSLPLSVVGLRLVGWGLPADASRVDHAIAGWPFVCVMLLLALLVVVRHTGNLKRVLRGEEPKIGASSRKTDQG